MSDIEKGCTFNHRDGFPEQELAEVKAERDALKTEVEALTRKGEDLCQSYGNYLMVLHAKDAELARLTQKLVNIRALPERSPKCSCFDIANKALRSHDAALEGREG